MADASSRDDDRELSADDTEPGSSATLSVAQLLVRLSDPLAIGSSRRDVLARLLAKLRDADHAGLTADQVHMVLSRVVLTRHQGHAAACTPTLAAQLLANVHLAKAQLLKERSVRIILGALGGSLGRLGGSKSSSRSSRGGMEGVMSGEDEDEDEDEDEEAGGRAARTGRVVVPLRVQVALLKLLILMHDPPVADLEVFAASNTAAEAPQRGAGGGGAEDDVLQTDPGSAVAGTTSNVLPPSLLSPEAARTLEGGYGVLWHLLDYLQLRPYVCHLLCKLTRRKHVKQYRIAQLFTLRAQYPGDASILAVLQTFASYSPALLFTDTTLSASFLTSGLGSSTSGTLRYPSWSWLQRSVRMWQRSDDDDGGGPTDGPGAAPSVLRLAGGAKRARLSGVPANRLAALLPSSVPLPLSRRSNARLLRELDDMRSLGVALAMDRIAAPPQAGAALADPTLAMLVLAEGGGGHMGMRGSSAAAATGRKSSAGAVRAAEVTQGDMLHYRVSAYVAGVVEEHLSLAGGAARLVPLLRAAHGFYRASGVVSRHAESWLRRLWQVAATSRAGDGPDLALVRAISKLFALLAPRPWAEMSDWCRLVEGVALKSQPACAAVIGGFKELMEHWGRADWLAKLRGLERGAEVYFENVRLQPEIDYLEAIQESAAFGLRLADSSLASQIYSLELQHATLGLLEALSQPQLASLQTGSIPALRTLYFATLSPTASVMSFSRMCGVLQAVRVTHERHAAALATPPEEAAGEGNEEATDDELGFGSVSVPRRLREARDAAFAVGQTERLNLTVVAMADLVWRNKAVEGDEGPTRQRVWKELRLDSPTMEELKARAENRGDQFGFFASLTHGAAFVRLAESYANRDADKSDARSSHVVRGAITAPTLREARKLGVPLDKTLQEFRASLLHHLATAGAARGLGALLYAVISSLSPKAGGSAPSPAAGGAARPRSTTGGVAEDAGLSGR